MRAAEGQCALRFRPHPPEKYGGITETIPDAPVKRHKVLVVIHDLFIVDGYNSTPVLLHQFSVHGSESLRFFLNLLLLQVSHIATQGCGDDLVRWDVLLTRQSLHILGQIGL